MRARSESVLIWVLVILSALSGTTAMAQMKSARSQNVLPFLGRWVGSHTTAILDSAGHRQGKRVSTSSMDCEEAGDTGAICTIKDKTDVDWLQQICHAKYATESSRVHVVCVTSLGELRKLEGIWDPEARSIEFTGSTESSTTITELVETREISETWSFPDSDSIRVTAIYQHGDQEMSLTRDLVHRPDRGSCRWALFGADTSAGFSSVLFEPSNNMLGGILVASSYVLILVAFAVFFYRGIRAKAPTVPIVSSCGMIALAGIVVLHGPPFDRWLDLRVAADLFPANLGSQPVVLGAWYAHMIVFALLFCLYVWYGRQYAPTPLLRKYFHPLVFGILIVTTITVWFFILYYRDFYVNEIYPVVTLVMAAELFSVLIFRTARARLVARGYDVKGVPLSSLSEVGAWGAAFGTALLYMGTVVGSLDQAYTDHKDTGYCLIVWVYGFTIVVMLLFAALVSRARREFAAAEDRPQIW